MAPGDDKELLPLAFNDPRLSIDFDTSLDSAEKDDAPATTGQPIPASLIDEREVGLFQCVFIAFVLL